jgi:hypothetical protein
MAKTGTLPPAANWKTIVARHTLAATGVNLQHPWTVPRVHPAARSSSLIARSTYSLEPAQKKGEKTTV